MEFIALPSGTLVMGDERLSAASPQHRVQVNSFSIGKYPVTNAEFAEFMRAGGYTAARFWTAMGWKWMQARIREELAPGFWHDARFNQPAQPVVGVSWYEAVAFCNWLTSLPSPDSTGAGASSQKAAGGTFRLPTEAEWEYAARGENRARNFPWGDKFERGRANTAELGIGATTRVDAFPNGVSPFGVWDLSGNVFEWTLCRWGVNWQELQYVYPYRDDERNEVEGSGARVMRGGSWFTPAAEALCAYRSRYLAGSRGSNIGFRVARVTG
jgi:formylglycine-generating enzyme required for sulfatase activity